MGSAAPRDDPDALISAASIAQQPDLVLRLFEFLGLAYDAIFLRDTQSTITYWDAGAARLYGWAEAEARGRVSHELLRTEFPPLPQPIDALLLDTGHWEGELRHRRRDGSQIMVESRQVVLRDASGAPISILETNRDITRRRQGQAAQAQLAAIVESSDDAILGQTLEGVITSWNQGAEQLYGYTAAEAIGRSVNLIIPPDRPEELSTLLERVRRGERVLQYETERITKDGRRLHLVLTISPIRDAEGQVVGASVIARDISGRKRMEEALAVSLSQLETVLQSAAEGIMVQSPSGEIVYANDAAAQLCGFPSAEALRAAPITEVLQHFELLDEAGDPFPLELLPARQALQHGTPAEAILRTRPLRGGDEHWSISRARPVLDAGGAITAAVSAFQDVTPIKLKELHERFLSEAAAVLAQSLDYDTTLARVAALAVPVLADWATVDLLETDGTIRRVALWHRDPAKVAWARELERRYPTDPAATVGVPQVIRSGRPEFYSEIPQALLDAAMVDDEARQILEQLQLTSYLIVPLRARGATLGAISFVYAESRRHYAEADLALAQELADRAALAVDNARLYRDALTAVHVRDEFLASVSHDLRTPLTTIRGSGQYALRQLQRRATPGTERTIGALNDVIEAAGRMERMIASLLDLARLESGRPVDIDRQQMDLVSLVRELVGEHQRGARGRQILLDAAQPEIRGLWDPVRVERVVDNLLSNAVKYSPSGGTIQVRLSAESDEATGMRWARLDVEDSGIGIPAADLPRIFERFHRGSNVPEHTSGIGIGLAGARQIAELHGGTLTVESEEGVGSVFTLRLLMTPLEPEEA